MSRRIARAPEIRCYMVVTRGSSAQAVSSEEDIAADSAPDRPPEGAPKVGPAQRDSGPATHPRPPWDEGRQPDPPLQRVGRPRRGGYLDDFAGQRLCRGGIGKKADGLPGYYRACPGTHERNSDLQSVHPPLAKQNLPPGNSMPYQLFRSGGENPARAHRANAEGADLIV